MRSKFAIGGHPVHPMLVAIPIGLFLWAFGADIIYLATDKDKQWYDMSFWTGIAAMVTAAVAALPGLGDSLTVASKSDAAQMGLAHLVLNVIVIALYFIAMLFMLDTGALRGTDLTIVVILHAIGCGILALSGWLGAEMVYRHHIAMVPDDSESERVEVTHHQTGSLRSGLRPR